MNRAIRLTGLSAWLIGTAVATGAPEPPPYENEVIVVTGDKLSRERALKIIKSGLSESQSQHPDDADRIVCRIEAVTGSRCKQLWCSTNRELKQIHDQRG